MSDSHTVYAITSAGRADAAGLPKGELVVPALDAAKVRVSDPFETYTEALDRWYELDDLRREGKLPQVAFFVVRFSDDPDWPALSPLRLIYTRPAKNHTSSVQVYGYSEAARYAAVRAYRERGGDPGRGGWFYEINSTWVPDRRNRLGLRRQTLAQGYRDLIRVALSRGWIVKTATGYARILVPSEVTA